MSPKPRTPTSTPQPPFKRYVEYPIDCSHIIGRGALLGIYCNPAANPLPELQQTRAGLAVAWQLMGEAGEAVKSALLTVIEGYQKSLARMLADIWCSDTSESAWTEEEISHLPEVIGPENFELMLDRTAAALSGVLQIS